MSLKAFAKKRFLIADPLESYCFATKKLLIDLGLKLVSTANSAPVVLSGVQNVDYDVILCNFELGEGKNGQELLEELRVRKLLRFSCLFFIVTAEVARDKVLGTIENEPDGYLVKPLTPANLEKRLTLALQQKEALSGIDEAIDRDEFDTALAACNEKLSEPSQRHKLVLQRIKAWLLIKTDQFEAAQLLYQGILANTEQPWARLGLADILTKQQQFNEAEAQLTPLIETEQVRIEAYDLLAAIRQFQQQPEAAQRILEKATTQSPNSIKRQQALAEARLTNGDQQGAIEALRKVVKLGSQSVFSEPDHYYRLANVLAASSGGMANSKAGREALDVLSKSTRRFSEHPQIDLQSSLVETQIRIALGEPDVAESLLQSTLEKASLRKAPLNGATALVASETLIKLGQGEKVDSFLQDSADAAAAAGMDVTIIYQWLDKRVSYQQRRQATELNKAGLKWHKAGQLEEAIQSMHKAITLTPHHISLNLNLIQLLIKKIKLINTGNSHQSSATNADAKQACQLAQACFYRIRHMPEGHREYPRHQHLKKLFQQLS